MHWPNASKCILAEGPLCGPDLMRARRILHILDGAEGPGSPNHKNPCFQVILYGVEETTAALAIRDAVEAFVIRARS